MRIFEKIAISTWTSPTKWIVTITLLSLFFLSGIPFLQFEFDLMRFNSEELEVTSTYHLFESEFGPTERRVFLIPKTEHHAFHRETLRELSTLSDTLKNIPGIVEISSLENLVLPIYMGFGYVPENKVIHGEISESDSAVIRNLPIAEYSLFTKNARYPVLTITIDQRVTIERMNEILESVHSLSSDRFSEHHLMGRHWAEYQYNQMLTTETFKGLASAVLIVIVMLWILFKRIGSILLPALAILTGMFSFFGLKGWAGWPMDILGTLFPPLLLIVGLSDVVHLYAKVQWRLTQGNELKTAIREAWKETGAATFLTSLTTAIGFMSLLTTDVLPIRNFGVEAGWSVLIMFISCLVVMPLFFRLAVNRPALLPAPATNKNWNELSDRVTQLSKRNWPVPILFTLAAMFSIYQASKVESGVVNYWQIEPSSTLGKDIQFFEEEDGGLRNLDIGVVHADTSLRMDTPEDMRLVAQFTERLRSNPAIGAVISSSDVPSLLNMTRMGGQLQQFKMGESDRQVESDLDWWASNDPESNYALISKNSNIARVILRLQNVKTDSARAIQDWISDELHALSSEHKVIFTGNSLIMDTMNDRLVENMMTSLLLAFLVIAVLMSFMFKSLRMLILSLIPNTFPLVIAIGVIGGMAIPMGTSIAMVLTIAFVIAVDDTIHYLMKFRNEIQKTNRIEEAVKNTTAQVGRAMILSSTVMLAAFIPLFFSSFLEEKYFAAVLSIVVISALLADLIVLPWLLLRFYKRK
ncbi:efflux RND transporter permease subunit [Phaeocystidibacter marisrubri]|uniref:MMPL family transporter n=1 Tax=Phaeocystidibacter marisrubri TaxID=1577780 RepID=A0A6L3ZIQ5_9FLAO|nr:MMPL family transporter [Phaeocystidibacter marisrubri]KAB2817896.1 MMPL family transporter [Phaeocystidibacter marisrubri]GGH72992.1 transporter [Phaeocystidibacter marisrubri]